MNIIPGTNEQMTTEFEIYNSVWSLTKEFYNVNCDPPDEVWEMIIEKVEQINKKYEKCEPHLKTLCVELCLAFLKYVQQKSKQKEGK